MSLKIGALAPEFTLPADDGTTFSLQAHRGRKVMLVFYPGDETPVCTAQLCEYSEGIGEFADLGVDVIGISKDDLASHISFKKKRKLNFPLLSDGDLAVAKLYGVKGLLGMKRAVFLVDEKGLLRYQHVEAVALFKRSKDELLKAIATA
jgi:thioredoxin-dependent peroxiredoxin